MIQGGDCAGTGKDDISIYGGTFEDENFDVKHSCPGIITMANAERNTNGTEFMILTVPADFMDGKHVAFGQVIKGMGVVRAVENTRTAGTDQPLKSCVVVDCGVLNEEEIFDIIPEDGDIYEDYPEDQPNLSNIEDRLIVAENVKAIGNEYFKSESYDNALRKYEKILRYLDCKGENAEQDLTLRKLRSIIHSNTAACLLKQKHFWEAKEHCIKALENDENNVKARMRLGTANTNLNDFDGAIQCFIQCAALNNSFQKSATKEINKCKVLKKKYVASHARVFKALWDE